VTSANDDKDDRRKCNHIAAETARQPVGGEAAKLRSTNRDAGGTVELERRISCGSSDRTATHLPSRDNGAKLAVSKLYQLTINILIEEV